MLDFTIHQPIMMIGFRLEHIDGRIPERGPISTDGVYRRDQNYEVSRITEKVRLTLHAKQRMSEPEISMTEVYRVLRRGMIDDQPTKTERGEWKCKITLPLRGRRTAGVVVMVDCAVTQLLIKTVEWEDRR